MNLPEFYKTVKKLKEIRRAGWLERGVKDAESVADHSFMVAVLCSAFPKQGIDKDKAVKMALFHDLAESKIGDLITKEHWKEGGSITTEEKNKKEEKALKEILSHLEEKKEKEIFNIWKEFEEGETNEAKFVNDMDTLERTLQALDYRSKGNFKKPLEPFWDERNMGLIKDKNIKKLVEDIIDKGW
jgi:putative hydrolase of HD superfamily